MAPDTFNTPTSPRSLGYVANAGSGVGCPGSHQEGALLCAAATARATQIERNSPAARRPMVTRGVGRRECRGETMPTIPATGRLSVMGAGSDGTASVYGGAAARRQTFRYPA